MPKNYNFKNTHQGDLLFSFDGFVYTVIDSKKVHKAGKVYYINSIESEIKSISHNGKTVAFREKRGAPLYER